ncbi:alkaline phosphatase family protein [Actinomadura nitritigenes]|uniref:Alkaline phosphatase family protein n=1 Tax=Actinomadura nitritigenes TaxID=134602 RepID=A0ABS3REV7_9ACTN|nr:alkaline phosphatase family protein [Actinomadura nitritigenes]MBO2444769.1 alkaline phosphatase family protein [Actinomadura nitritigenes]
MQDTSGSGGTGRKGARPGVRRRPVLIAAAAVTAGLSALAAACGTGSGTAGLAADHSAAGQGHGGTSRSPIKHVVVIYGENISFDHYFGTYPKAANTDGTPFHAAKGTPRINGLTHKLLTDNPNQYDPKRLSPSQALTCDQDHGYAAEQKAVNGGKMDKFVENTGKDKCTGQPILFGEPGLVMDYYDGNTVTGMWNYAQNYAMSDNSWDSVFGPSTPGALNLISGQTHGGYAVDPVTHAKVSDSYVVASPNADGVGTVINDPDPAFDDCSGNNHTSKNNLAAMTGKNIGDLLNATKVTWGWFQGGFRPTGKANGYAVCGSAHANIGQNQVVDYSPHHEPFQYYKSTANEKHLPPSSTKAIGYTDQANHQYDLTDFDAALAAHNLPSVSFLKAAEYQDGHAGYSDPIDEQRFVTSTINKLQKSPEWASTAVVLAYDDSDGWYDHVAPRIMNGSTDPATDSPLCGKAEAAGGYQDRCGPSQRLPMLVVSPYAKVNHVDHRPVEQTSVLRFIEDNWGTGRIGDASFDARAGGIEGMFDFRHPKAKQVILDPATGGVVSRS